MFETIIRGAAVYDGTGGPARRADVAISGDRIAEVGAIDAAKAKRVIDAGGLALSPGFVDVHTHDDRLLFTDPMMTPKLSQGVTTVVTGNCGISLAPLGTRTPVPPLNLVAGAEGPHFDAFADYLAALDRTPPAINAACLVGHTSLRACTMAALDRPATAGEIDAMRVRLREAIDAGAIGVSTGTFYGPANAATREEVAAVMEPLRGTGAIIASHIRDEGDHVFEALAEVIAIAKSVGVRQVVSHHKVQGARNFGRSAETLAFLDRERESADVCQDCYPYNASSTILRVDSALQAKRVLVAWSEAMPSAAGRDLDEIAKEMRLTRETVIPKLQPAGAIYFSMDEADVERILAHPQTMVGSDGLPHDRFPHPRLWGTFPRVLGYYGRERGLFPLETAIHKMTGLSADRFGLRDVGRIEVGRRADLVLFDPATVKDAATFAAPTQPAVGIEKVFVGGQLAWSEGRPTGTRAGKALRATRL